MFSWTEARVKNDAAGKCHFYFSGYQYLEPHFFIGRPLVALFSVQKFLELQFLFCRLCIVQGSFAYVRARMFWRPSPSSNNGANIFIKPLNVEYQSEWTMPDSDISIVQCWPFDRHSIFRGPSHSSMRDNLTVIHANRICCRLVSHGCSHNHNDTIAIKLNNLSFVRCDDAHSHRLNKWVIAENCFLQ